MVHYTQTGSFNQDTEMSFFNVTQDNSLTLDMFYFVCDCFDGYLTKGNNKCCHSNYWQTYLVSSTIVCVFPVLMSAHSVYLQLPRSR